MANEGTLKMMKNDFFYPKNSLFSRYLNIYLSYIFGRVEKLLDQKDMVNFKIYDVTAWQTSNCNIHIAQYRKKESQSGNEIWSVKTK